MLIYKITTPLNLWSGLKPFKKLAAHVLNILKKCHAIKSLYLEFLYMLFNQIIFMIYHHWSTKCVKVSKSKLALSLNGFIGKLHV